MIRWLPLAALVLLLPGRPADPACCYFSAQGQDVEQPAQKAFLTWDPDEQVMSWTVQPKFAGNAADFGMVVPTPTQPKLAEMPREFFKALALFTILKPMDIDKYKNFQLRAVTAGGGRFGKAARDDPAVRVLEAGVVGSLDYKIVAADKADDLYQWLKDNKYQFAGDAASLDHYIRKKWFFTVMKIDPKQMKKNPDGSYAGEVTPTRFLFSSTQPVYPIRITQISVKTSTEALFYVLSKRKVDFPGDWSHRANFLPMWHQALSFAVPEKVSGEEKTWAAAVAPLLPELRLKDARRLTRLEYAKKLGDAELGVIDGTLKYDRTAPPEEVEKLKLLQGHLRKDLWLTKCRRVFLKPEMTDDLVLVDARIGEALDTIEYDRILPTSPP